MGSGKAVDRCPHCSKPLHVNLFAKAEAESSITLKLTPKKGSFLSVGTVGKTLANMEILIKAVGKEAGIKTAVFVKKLSTKGGEITADMLIVNAVPPARHQKASTVAGTNS